MLNTRKENIVKNTVARMPIHAVIPLLHEVGEPALLVLSYKPHMVCLLATKNPGYVSLFLKLVWYCKRTEMFLNLS